MVWKIVLGLFAAAIAFLIFGAIVGNTPEGKERQKARDVIELCRSDEKNFTGGAGAKAIITSTCMKFEDEFRAKFGVSP